MASLFYDIEPYVIQTNGMELIIFPLEDGVYRVEFQGKRLADLYPEITASGIHWNGFGQVSQKLAEKIGRQIYASESFPQQPFI